MERSYDEDITENRFFTTLQNKHKHLYQQATQQRFMICVPRTGVFTRISLSQNDFENHILRQEDEQLSIYETLNKKKAKVTGIAITTGEGFKESRSVHILFDETFYNANEESFRVLCIDRLLEGGTNNIEDPVLTCLETYEDCCEFLWGNKHSKTSQKKVDDLMEHFCSTSQKADTLRQIIDATSTLFTKCIQIALKDVVLRTMQKNAGHMDNLKIAMETYIMNGIYTKVFKAVSQFYAVEDANLNKITRNLSELQVKDVGVRLEFTTNVPRARREMSTINKFSTPLCKMQCLRKTVLAITQQGFRGKINDSARAMSSDDLLPLLVFLVVKSDIPNWLANLSYMQNFCLSNFAGGEFGFYMASIEAAVEHVKSGAMSNSTPATPISIDHSRFSLPPSSPSKSGSEPLWQKIDASDHENTPAVDILFQRVMEGNKNEVEAMLEASSTDYSWLISKMCHPLCSCDSCEQILASKRNDPRAVSASSRDNRGCTPMHAAAAYGHPEVISTLMRRGGEVNVTDYHGSTPLHLGCQRGHQDVTLLLLAKGSVVSIEDNDGNRPLHLCCANGHEECVKALLYSTRPSQRVSINATNTRGDTALHLASRWGYEPPHTSTPMKSASLPTSESGDAWESIDSHQQHKTVGGRQQGTAARIKLHYMPVQESSNPSYERPVSSSHGKQFTVPVSASTLKGTIQSSQKQLSHDHPYVRKPQESDQDPDCDEENDEEIEMERPPIDTNSPSTTDQPSTIVNDVQEGLDVSVFDLDLGAEEDVEDTDISNEESVEKEIISEKKCIVYESKLLQLLQRVHGKHCVRCNTPFVYRTVSRGTAIIVIWECEKGHKDSWSSQPRYNGMFAGNLHAAASILLSGNSFQKIATMCHFLELRMMTRSTFNRIQKLYMAPAVQDFYSTMQDKLLASYKEPVVLSGDGRSDSPGHSATFCTYSFCDERTKKILHTNSVMVQEASGKSPNMERIAFERGLDFVAKKVKVATVVTDAHSQIRAMLKRTVKYEGIRHQWDVWHGSKNLIKKISLAGQQKSCRDLLPWVPHIRNHFWYASQTCGGDAEKMTGSLAGILHHIVNDHEWLFTLDGRPGKCEHGVLGEDREVAWLQPGSPPHKKLHEIIMDKRFMKTLPYYVDFLHTGSLESFHSSLLMYAPKRTFFSLVGYTTRTKVAVLDFNFHSVREQAKTKDGRLKWGRRWNKRTKRFVVYPIMEPKTYAYIPDLIKAMFEKRATTPGHLSQHVSMAEDDPRRLHPTIAMRPATDVATLLQEQKSRFTTE